MARLPVTHRERAFDYCMRELGREFGALTPEGIVVKKTDTFYWSKGQSFNCAEAIPDGITLVVESDKPHAKHQEPFNCCSQWAVWGEDGSTIEPRLIPEEAIPLLRFGYPKSIGDSPAYTTVTVLGLSLILSVTPYLFYVYDLCLQRSNFI